MHGTRISLLIGFVVVFVSGVIGTRSGADRRAILAAGVDTVIMRLMDILLAFPAILLGHCHCRGARARVDQHDRRGGGGGRAGLCARGAFDGAVATRARLCGRRAHGRRQQYAASCSCISCPTV